jgi:hypothetical protein
MPRKRTAKARRVATTTTTKQGRAHVVERMDTRRGAGNMLRTRRRPVGPLVLLAMLVSLSSIGGEACASNGGGPEPPHGWRVPLPSEAMPEGDGSWRAPRPDHALKVSADFDGDGVVDHAALLVRESDRRLGVFVAVGRDHSWRQVDAAESSMKGVLDDPALISVIGIEVAAPGKYVTYCGRGYSDCSPSAPKDVTIKKPGLVLFKAESWSVLFYWDDESRRFTAMPLGS